MSKKLLLSDDSITIQKVVQITFAHEDYELTIADNGDSAFEKARELRPDLVMADVYMPGKNGYELCAALKQDPACHNIPVLLLAGSFEPFDEDKARASRADAWLVKPFESQVLIDKVAELLAASPEVAAGVGEQPFEPEAAAAEAAVAEEPSAESMEDPFGTISFDEELFSDEEVPEEDSDDWSDLGKLVESHEVSAGPGVDEPGSSPASEPVAAQDDFVAAGEAEADADAVDQGGAEEVIAGVAPADEEMFIFEDDAGEDLPAAAETEPNGFAEEDDEIMSLDDDDILGFEDLEPLEEEQTLAAWSRDKVTADTENEEPAAFGDVSEDDTPGADFSAAAVESEQPPETSDQAIEASEDDAMDDEPLASSIEPSEALEPAAGFEPAFESGAADEVRSRAEFVPASEPVADETAGESEPEAEVDAFSGLVMAESKDEIEAGSEVIAEAGSEIAARAAALDETEIEAIVEKVAGRVIEKLAGTILERVAWEVVPDLAEALIKEEISKIKDSAA